MKVIMFNSGIGQPEDKGIMLADIIECGFVDRDNSHCLDANYYKGGNLKSYFEKNRRQLVFTDKSQTLLATLYKENAKSMVKRNKKGLLVASDTKTFNQHTDGNLHYRKLTPRECFRLQTVPEHYIDKILACGVSNTQLYKIAGNGWTDEVIAHILRCKDQAVVI